MPPEKMRALVSLYHQADSFISPDHLSKAIDVAFIDSHISASVIRSDEDSYKMLERRVQARRHLPKIGQANTIVPISSSSSENWSDKRTERERKVINALWGVERPGIPGLEALEEEAEQIGELLRRDREGHS